MFNRHNTYNCRLVYQHLLVQAKRPFGYFGNCKSFFTTSVFEPVIKDATYIVTFLYNVFTGKSNIFIYNKPSL